MKKRTIAIMLSVMMISGVLTGCSLDISKLTGRGETKTESSTSAPEAQQEDKEDTAKSTTTSSSTGEESTSENASNTKKDIFDEEDDYNARQEAQTQTEQPDTSSESEEKEDLATDVSGKLKEIKSIAQLQSALHEKHDNSQYGKEEGLADYVGQISVSSVAYSVSNLTGLESDKQCNKLLNMRLVRKDFVYDPKEYEEAHEYYDNEGKLLFTIYDLDYTDGQSTGKYKVQAAGSGAALSFYSNDVDIALLEEYDMLGDGRKAEIGERKKEIPQEEKEAAIKKNIENYGEAKTVKDMVGEEKLNAVASAKVYYPVSELADDKGYVTIPVSSQYAQRLLNATYIQHPHVYKLNNKQNYTVFCDKDGKHLFTFNESRETDTLDLSVKMDDIVTGYAKGKIKELYPVDADIDGIRSQETTEIQAENKKE